MPGTRILARVGAACAIALAPSLSACGGEEDLGTIPQAEGDAVLSQLDELRGQLDAGDCDAAEATGQDIRDNIESISQDVSEELEQALVQASDNLASLTRTDCQEPEEPEEPEPPPPTGTSDDGTVLEDEG
ncbi:MAG TPA: hypothetical protein VD766_07770 [Solirubrobacterales bacterium]|nr:hypothetical protein [Solirubrobacterales bacterium]